MKKTSKAMRVACALAIATAMSTCVVAGTLAKYTTSATGEDSARVAQWGVTGTSFTTGNLFAKTYTDANNGETVKSANTDNVIAPGTEGSASFGLSVKENPEVAYTFKVNTTGSLIDDGIKNNASIQWKLDTGSYGTWDDLMTSIEGLSEAGTINPGAVPATNGTHTVYWKWTFDGNDTGDTTLGNKATLDQVKLFINVTATQVD